MVMMISDETGEGKMTVHQILPGIMICFTDMHMEQCMSEFELNSGQKVLWHRPMQRRTHRDGKPAGNLQYYAGK